jgi:hypothetical protein
MQQGGSLLCSPQQATGPCPQPHETISRSHTRLFKLIKETITSNAVKNWCNKFENIMIVYHYSYEVQRNIYEGPNAK